MPKVTHLDISVVKDCTIVTAVKKASYMDQSSKTPQRVEYPMQHGLTLMAGQEIAIDLRDEQLPAIQAAVDSGDITVPGMSPKAKK